MAFLPTGYKIPDTGGRYFKPKKGENKVRILTEPIIGYEAWDKRGEKAKPIRADKDDKEGIEELHRISALQENDDDKRVKHFWAMVIAGAVGWELLESPLKLEVPGLFPRERLQDSFGNSIIEISALVLAFYIVKRAMDKKQG